MILFFWRDFGNLLRNYRNRGMPSRRGRKHMVLEPPRATLKKSFVLFFISGCNNTCTLPLPPPRARPQAHPADGDTLLVLHLFEIPFACRSIEPGLPRLILAELSARERTDRANIHTRRAVAAPGCHR